MLRSEELWQAQAFARAAGYMRSAAEGLHWAVPLLPLSEGTVAALRVGTAVMAVLVTLGLFTRWALVGLSVCVTALFALPHFAGTPRHSMHLVWFVLVLALSPAGRVLSLDYLWARRRGKPMPWTSQGRWLATASLWTLRALLGVVYFFPGFWKLTQSGLHWALSDNLQNQMYWKWAQFGVVPEFRLDSFPWLLQFGALSVLLLELVFPFLLWSRWTRVLAAVLGIAFHELAGTLMYIGFSSLWWCYVVLIDWAALVRWVRRRRGGRGSFLSPPAAMEPSDAWRALSRWPARALVVTLCALLLATVVQGARGQMMAYPFACYPTFQWRAAPRMPDLRITLLVDGEERTLPDGPASFGARSQYRWGSAWRAMGLYDGKPKKRLLRAYLDGKLKEDPALRERVFDLASAARFYRVDIDVRPGHWSDPAPTRLLAEVPLTRPK